MNARSVEVLRNAYHREGLRMRALILKYGHEDQIVSSELRNDRDVMDEIRLSVSDNNRIHYCEDNG